MAILARCLIQLEFLGDHIKVVDQTCLQSLTSGIFVSIMFNDEDTDHEMSKIESHLSSDAKSLLNVCLEEFGISGLPVGEIELH